MSGWDAAGSAAGVGGGGGGGPNSSPTGRSNIAARMRQAAGWGRRVSAPASHRLACRSPMSRVRESRSRPAVAV
jgi:hypothetical protein